MNFEKDIVDVYFALIKVAQSHYYHDERAHDLAADAVLRAMEHRECYDETRPLMTWCRAIMRNLYINTQSCLSVTQTTRMGEWDSEGGEEADQLAIVNDMRSVIDNCRSVCMDTLQRFSEGYSIAEIAEGQGLPQGTVKRRIHDARNIVRKHLS